MKHFFLLLLLISGFSLSAQYKIGDTAKDFSLKGVDGNMHSISKDGGRKGTVVVFTCNHCPYAVLYEDRIMDIQKKFSPLGVEVIAINPNDPVASPDDSFEKMVVRAKEKSYNFPYIFDESQKVYPAFGATRTPHVFLLDAQNVVRYIGALDDNARKAEKVKVTYLADAIEAMLGGKDIDPTTTKAIGCSIKVQ